VATAWQTLEEAALTLGISSRTLHRRLARNEFQTRLENGRREVLVVIPDPTPFPELKLTPDIPRQTASHAADTPGDMSAAPSAREVRASDESADEAGVADASDALDDVGHAMLTLHEDRIRRTDLAIMAYQQSVNVTAADARRAHVRTKVAWGVTAGLMVMAFVGAVWATHTVTRAKGEVSHLEQVVRQLTGTADAKSAEAERLRQEAQSARIAAARVEGQLEAAKGQIEQLRESAMARASSAQASPAAYDASATTQPAAPATTQPVSALTDTIQRVTLRK